ncbi:hypothetical protein [Plasmodium yoelii yoelii]|uniref:Uncharacterized protein n=1 Tax=Plasmodium yoelii yoelii TaxID=73239 RepID=Q7RSS2_PLAYO|nr:hypothetical protein [Plasmodium yoelii yoelii]
MHYKGINVIYFVKDPLWDIWFYIIKIWAMEKSNNSIFCIKCIIYMAKVYKQPSI